MNKLDFLNYLSDKILNIRNKIFDRCIIIGIEGRDCSGKSTFAKEFRDFLLHKNIETAVASIDDFCNKRAIRYTVGLTPDEQFYYKNFDYNLFENKILKECAEKGCLIFDEIVFNDLSDEFDRKVTINVSNQGILLVEGIFLYKDEFKKYFDFSLRFEISETEQLKRAIKRDLFRFDNEKAVLDRYLNKYIPGQKLYESIDKPFDFADIVADNTILNQPKIIKPNN